MSSIDLNKNAYTGIHKAAHFRVVLPSSLFLHPYPFIPSLFLPPPPPPPAPSSSQAADAGKPRAAPTEGSSWTSWVNLHG